MSRFVLNAQLQLQAPNNTAQVVRQIQRQLGNVSVNLNVTGQTQVQRQLRQTTTSVNNLNRSANNLGRSFAVVVRRFAAFSIATRAVTLLSNRLSSAVDEAIAFEREINKIAQVTGKSVKSLQSLTAEITRLSVTLGVSSQELANVGRILSQAGFKANDLTFALKALAKTDLAPTFENLQKTTEGAIAVFNQFGQGAKALEGQLGAINAVAGKFAVESSDLIGAVSRVGGVFSAAGGNLEQLIALFTSVRATTRESAESIATGLRTILTRIQRPSTIKFLEDLGVSLTDLNGKFVGPFQAVQALGAEFSKLEQGDLKFVQIAEELGGFRQIGKVIPLIQQYTVAQEALNVAKEGQQSLDKDVETAQKSLAVQIAQLREEWIALVRSFADTGTFRALVKSSLGLASALAKVLESLKPLLPILAGGLLGRGAIAAGGGLRRVFGFNRGGMVPGSGNRDTVPAMLTPGEFVIRKDSVNQIGAGALAAMNENRFAQGGIVALHPYDEDKPNAPTTSSQTVSAAEIGEKLGTTGESVRQAVKNAGAKVTDPGLRTIGTSGRTTVSAIGSAIGDKSVARFEDTIAQNFAQGVNSASKSLARSLGSSITTFFNPEDSSKFNLKAIIGSAFEATLTTMGAPFSGKTANEDAFDFAQGLGPNLAKAFGDTRLSDIPVDAKRTLSSDNMRDLLKKKFPNYYAELVSRLLQKPATSASTASALGAKYPGGKTFSLADARRELGNKNLTAQDLLNAGITSPRRGKYVVPRGFATGGGISGQDTVPALLTPGEFVINRESASRIGRGTLERMNRDGVVGFNRGGSVGPVRLNNGGQAPAGFNAFAGIIALQSLPAIISSYGSTVDEEGNKISTVSSRIADAFAGLLTPISGVILGLQAFGVELNRAGIQRFLGNFRSGTVARARPGRFAERFNTFSNSADLRRRAVPFSTQASGIGGRLGRFLGRGVARGGAIGRVAGLAGGAINAGGAALGGAAAAVPLIAAAGVAFVAVNKAITGFIGAQSAYEKAVREGNKAEAEKNAVLKETPGIVQAFTLAFSDSAADSFLDFMSQFGGESSALVRSRAAAAVATAKADKEKEDNAKAAAAALKEFENGTGSASNVLGAFSKNGLNNLKVQEQNLKTIGELELNKSGSGTFTARNILTLGGLLGETSGEKNERISKEQEALRGDNKARRDATFKELSSAIGGIAKNTPLKQSFDEILKVNADFATAYRTLSKDQQKSLRDSLEAERKIRLANIEFLKSLNFGLRDVNGAIDAATVSFANFKDRQAGTATEFSQSARILGASLTGAAQFISDSDFESALQTFRNNITQFGGSEGQANTAVNSISAFRDVQAALPEALRRLQGNAAFTTGSPLGDAKFIREIGNNLYDILGTDNPELRRVIGSFNSVRFDDELRSQISNIFADGGDIGDIADKILAPLGKGIADKLQPLLDKRAKLEDDYNSLITKLTNQRKAAEESLRSAETSRIDLLLDLSRREAEVGIRGRVTARERLTARRDQFNISARGAGIGGLVTGSASEIRNADREIRDAARPQQQARLNAIRNDGTRIGPETQTLKELGSTSTDLIKFGKQRLDILKDEIDLARKKNSIERSGLEALVGGDVDTFFQKAGEAAAASAIRNNADLSGFSSQQVLAALRDSELSSTLSSEQRVNALLNSSDFGLIGGRRQAESLVGTSSEERLLQTEFSNVANALREISTLQTSFSQFNLDEVSAELQSTTRGFTEALNQFDNNFASNADKILRGGETMLAATSQTLQTENTVNINLNGEKLGGVLAAINNESIANVVVQAVNQGMSRLELDQGGINFTELTVDDVKLS